jgi:anti-sigma regulatory factor (Ser/Thr protein kinase)
MPPEEAGPATAALADVSIPLGILAPSAARAVVRRCLVERAPSSLIEEAQLLISELVTNSVRHSGAPEGDDIGVRVHLWRGMCRLEVEDQGCDGVIGAGRPGSAVASGIGLNLVQALSERWGVVRVPDGPTRVWAQLPCGGESRSRRVD